MLVPEDVYNLQVVLIWSLCFLSVTMALLKFFPVPKSVYHTLDQNKEHVVFAEFISYFPSFVNAVTCFFFGLSVLIENGIQINSPNRDNESLLLAFTTGYFVCDTITGFVYKFNDGMMVLHHLLSVTICVYVMHTGSFANATVLALVISELSNVFRTVEKITDKYPEQKRTSFMFSLCFAISFVFCRLAHKHGAVRSAGVDDHRRAESPGDQDRGLPDV